MKRCFHDSARIPRKRRRLDSPPPNGEEALLRSTYGKLCFHRYNKLHASMTAPQPSSGLQSLPQDILYKIYEYIADEANDLGEDLDAIAATSRFLYRSIAPKRWSFRAAHAPTNAYFDYVRAVYYALHCMSRRIVSWNFTFPIVHLLTTQAKVELKVHTRGNSSEKYEAEIEVPVLFTDAALNVLEERGNLIDDFTREAYFAEAPPGTNDGDRVNFLVGSIVVGDLICMNGSVNTGLSLLRRENGVPFTYRYRLFRDKRKNYIIETKNRSASYTSGTWSTILHPAIRFKLSDVLKTLMDQRWNECQLVSKRRGQLIKCDCKCTMKASKRSYTFQDKSFMELVRDLPCIYEGRSIVELQMPIEL